VRPFSRNLRSELTKTPKIFFHDTGLMQMLWLKRLQREVLGPVFETSLFGELVKKYGVENIHYWRTQDRKEIDFILKTPDGLLPIEVKLNFPRNLPAALHTFAELYQPQKTLLVGLSGETEKTEMIYPWQLP
jgi:predicted AAA+ superfamily ATPase